MRRAEREIASQAEMRAILARERVVRLAFAVADEPYLVPVSYGYDVTAHALFFHTARVGRKLDFVARNPRVCFEIEGPSRVTSGRTACQWSVEYESLIGYGTVCEVTEPVDREHGLRCLMQNHAGSSSPWTFDERQLAATRIWRLSIESLRGKRARSS